MKHQELILLHLFDAIMTEGSITQLREAHVDLAIGPMDSHDRSLRSIWLFESRYVLQQIGIGDSAEAARIVNALHADDPAGSSALPGAVQA